MSKVQMDLVGYFGFPSDANPEPSRAKSKKQVKRRSSVHKSGVAAIANIGAAVDTVADDVQGVICKYNKPEKSELHREEPADKRARVSLDSIAEVNEKSLVDDIDEFSDEDATDLNEGVVKHNQEFTNDESLKKPKILTAEELTQQRLDRYWEKRRQNSRSEFSIRSTLYGQTKQLSTRLHQSRLLKGKGSTNILSQLFQRSVQPDSYKTRDMASYIQSGQHWNISSTVELDTHRISGEISAMSFDREGVLLATGDDRGFVRIYDFDDVNALDIAKRNEQSRLLARTEHDAKSADAGLEDEQMQNGDELPHIRPAQSKHILSFRCTSYRITDLQWNPNNQDQLAVSFAQSPEIHLYNVASSKTPLPKVTISASNGASSKGREGISVMRFFTSTLQKKMPTQILTGGSRGTVRLWLVPGMKKGQTMKDVHARCIWSVDTSESSGEGCSDMLVLPSVKQCASDKPLVLLSGQAGSLVLLNTAKCTRKSFSTTVTPTIQSTWDLYNLTARELTKRGDDVKLPARRWMGVNKMNLLDCNFTNGVSSHKMSFVLNCGWVLGVNLTVTQLLSTATQSPNFSAAIRVQILHQTPRIQCFNSMHEKVTVLGGMALNCSLPDIPTPSSLPINSLKQIIWVGDVKPKKYTMPSKDKFVLCEQHGTLTADASSKQQKQRQPGDGLILLDVASDGNKYVCRTSSLETSPENSDSLSHDQTMGTLLARLPLSNGTPLSMAMHPAGEWLVVGYGLNGRVAANRTLEIVCMRKSLS